MKFNIVFLGPEALFHVRRDFLLALRFGLADLGHDAVFSWRQVDTTRFNLLIGAYFLEKHDMAMIDQSGTDFAHVNTEVIAQDMLNFNPTKTDFLGAYLPSMRKGKFVWDVILDNLEEHRRYGNNAHFLRWGWLPQMEDIVHREPRDLDFYFFGLMSPRRVEIIQELEKRGFSGSSDHSCPYFLRNDRIARAKVNLNIVQHDKYTHVNSFRVCYLANNRCATLSEAEKDPAGYLAYTQVVERREDIADGLAQLLAGDAWRRLGETSYQRFRELPMKRCLEEALDASFASPSQARVAG